jgi:hypothetical protein
LWYSKVGFLKFLFYGFFFFTFTLIYTHYLCTSTPALLPGRTCSILLFSNFVAEIIRNIVFLLVSDKDSYTERFLQLLLCLCILQPILVYLYQTSSLLPSPLPTVAPASLRLLYSPLYSEHINHIQVLRFLPFPCSSHTWSPLSV